jgi:hypothetical protein
VGYHPPGVGISSSSVHDDSFWHCLHVKKANQVLIHVHDYMIKNELHIKTTKSVYMHIRPGRYSSCARAREFGSEKHLKLAGHSLLKVNKVKFLAVVIDDELTWEYHIEHMREKLNCGINIIKYI